MWPVLGTARFSRDEGVGRGGVCHSRGRAPPPLAQEWEAEAAEQMAKAQNNFHM